MRTSYKVLTNDEYNVLNVIASRTKDNCWFCLKQDKSGTDYVWNIEGRRRLCLKTGVETLAWCLDYYDTYKECRLNCFEDLTFRELLKKLDIPFDIPYAGPALKEMYIQDFVKCCKENDVKYKKYRDDILVGDMIHQFGRDGKWLGFVSLNLDKDMRLESRGGLDARIHEAKRVGELQGCGSDVKEENNITR